LPALSVDALDRLLSRLESGNSTPGLDFPCLNWTGYIQRAYGYGQINVGGKALIVSRLMWELCNRQPIPPGFVVRHQCDNPRCCEPTHLELGTHADNVADRVERGRSACGVRNGRAKLTSDRVRMIKRRCDEPVRKLAREFGVDPRAIRAILSGQTWKDG
jgi:hypothetical protein